MRSLIEQVADTEALITHEVSRQAVLLVNARRALERAETIPELRTLINQADVVRQAAKKVRLGLEAQNDWAIYKLDAIRKAGATLDAMELHAGRPGEPNAPTLGDLGIESQQSSRWQRIAAIPDELYQEWVNATRSTAEVTEAAALRLAVGESIAEPEPEEPEGRDLAPLMSSADIEWYTPWHILEAVAKALGGIDLDPCAEPAKKVPAAEHFTLADDGLNRPWHGKVYMNPPYGKTIGAWVDKLADEYESGRVTSAIALVPARTDTSWWAHLPASAVCFITGRLAFSDHENPAPFPSAVCYLGSDERAFAEAFIELGLLYVRLEMAA